jgi:hypothetical protein
MGWAALADIFEKTLFGAVVPEHRPQFFLGISDDGGIYSQRRQHPVTSFHHLRDWFTKIVFFDPWGVQGNFGPTLGVAAGDIKTTI